MVMAKHHFGNAPVIRDVCRSCNGGVLSRLDEAASDWWSESSEGRRPVLTSPHSLLARWLGKIVYNVQRVERRERGELVGPPVPDFFVAWITGRTKADAMIAVWLSLFPIGHEAAVHSGIAGTDQRLDRPVWLIGLRRFFFCVAWDHPVGNGFARQIETEACVGLPAARLDLDRGAGALAIPLLRDPDRVYESLYGIAVRFAESAGRL